MTTVLCLDLIKHSGPTTTNTSRGHNTTIIRFYFTLDSKHLGLTDSRTLIFQIKYNIYFHVKTRPLSNSAVLCLLRTGKVLLMLSLVLKWFDMRNLTAATPLLNTSVCDGTESQPQSTPYEICQSS